MIQADSNRALTGAGSALTILPGERKGECRNAILIPTHMIRERGNVQQAVSTKDRLHHDIKSVADNRERNAQFSASAVKGQNTVINGKGRRERVDGPTICAD